MESHAIPFPEAHSALEMMNNLLTPPRVRAELLTVTPDYGLTVDSALAMLQAMSGDSSAGELASFKMSNMH